MGTTPMERFLAKVNAEGDCWIWTGCVGSHGYGSVRVNKKGYLTHRWLYEQLVGPIPDGATLDHLCRVKRCCNPDHLEPVSMAENLRRGYSPPARNGRKTHCNRGHELSGDNVYIQAKGWRQCRICQRITMSGGE